MNEVGLALFARLLRELAVVIAWEWSSPPRGDDHFQGRQDRVTSDQAGAILRDLALRGGGIHPEFTPDQPRLFGAWSA